MDPQLFLPSSELPKYDWTECTSCDVAAALNGDPDFIEESAGAIVVSNLGRTFAAASNKNNISNNNIGSSALGNQSPPLRPFSSFLSTSISSIADPTSFLVHHVEIPTDVVPVACPPQILETVLQQLRSMRAVPMKQLNLENDEYQIPERENTNVLLRFRTMPPAEDQFINLSPSRMPIVTFAVVYAPTAKAEGAQKALNYLKRRMSEAETKGHLQLLIVSPEYQVVSSSSTMSSNNLGSNSTASLSQQQLPQRQPKPRSSHSSSSSSTFGNNKIRCIIPDMPEPSSTFVHIPWCVSGNTVNNNNNNTKSKSSPFTTTETTPEVTASPLLPTGSTATFSTSSFGQQQQQQPPATAKTPYDTKVILQNFCVTVATAGAAWACGRLRSLSGTSNATFFATALDEPRFSLLQGDNDPSGRIEMRAAKYRADLHLLLGRPIQAYRGLNHRQLFVRSAARGPGDFLWICSASDTLCAIRWLCLKGVLMTAKRDADWIFANRACFADSVAAKPDDYEKARKTLNGIWGRWSNALRIDHTGKSDAFDCYVNWAQQFQWSCTSFDGTLPEFNNNVFNGGSHNTNNNNINQTNTTNSNNNVGGVLNNTNNTNSTPNTATQGNNNNNANSSNNNNNGNQPFTEAQREQMKAQRAIIISQQCVPAREFDDFLDNIFHDFEEDLVANIQSLQDVGSRVIFTGSDRIAAVPRLEAEARYLHFLAIRCIVQPTSVRAPRILLSSCRDFVRKYLAYAHSVSKELNEHFSRLNSINNNTNHNGAPQDPAQPKIAAASPSYISCLLNGLDKFKTIRFGMAWLLRRAGLHRSAVEFLREALCSIASMIYASYNNNNGGGSSTSSSTAANAIIASPIHDPVLMMELWTELLRWVGVNGSAPLSAGTLLASSTASALSSGNNFLSSSSFYQCGGKTFIDSILPEIEKASPNRTSPITGDIVRAFVEQAFSGIVFATASPSTSSSSSLSSASTTTGAAGGGQPQTQHSRTLSGQSKSFPPNFTAKQLALQMKRQHITAAINTMRIRAATLTLLRINDSFFSDEVCVDFFRRFLASSGSGREMQQSSIFVNYENNNQPSLPSNMNTPQNFGYESSNNALSSPIAPSSSSSTRNFQQQQQQRQLTTALQSQQQSLMMQTSLNASPNGECGAGLSVIGVESKPLPSHLAPQPVRSHGYMEGAFKDDYYYAKNPITGVISRTGPVIWVVDEVCVLHVEIHNAFVFPLQVDRVALRNNNKSKNAANVGIAFDSTMLTIPAQQTMAVDLFFQPVVIGDAELDGVVWTSSMLCGSSELEFFSPFPTPLVTPVMDELPSATMRIAQDLSIITPYSGNNGTPNRHHNNNGNNNGTQNQVNNTDNNNSGNDTSSLEPNLRFQPQLPEITIFQGQKVEIPITVINTGKTAIPLTQEKLDRATKMWYSTMNASAHEQHCQLRVCAGCASVVQILAPNLMGLRTLDAGEEFLTTLVVNPKEGWIVPSQSTLLNSNTTNSNALKVTELSTVTAPAAAAGPMITVSNAAAVSKHNHSYSLAVVSPRMAMHKYSQSLLQSGGGMAASLRAPNSGLLLAAPPPPPFFVPPAIIQPVKSNVRLEVFASKEPPFTIEQSEISKLSAASSVFCHLPARVTRLNLNVNILPSVRALSVSLSASKRILVSMINDNREWAVEMKREVHVMSDRGEILDTLKITGDVLCGPGQTQPIVVPISTSSRSSTTATSNNNNINISAADTTPLPRNNNNFPSPNGQIFVSPGNNNNSNNTPVAILKEAYSLVFHWQYLQCYEKFREGKTEVPLASIRHQISDRFSVADLSVSVTVASEELVHHQNEGDNAHRNHSNNYFENFDDCGAEQGSLPLHSPFLKTIKKWNVKSTDMVVESDETIPVDVLGNYRVQVVITAPKSWLLNNNDANNNNTNNNPITTFDVDFDIPGGAMIDGCTNGSLEFKNQIISLLSTSVHRNRDNTVNAPASGNNSRQGTNLEFFAVGEAEASQEEEAAAAAPLAKKRKSVNIIEDDNNNNKLERGANSKIENNNHLSGFSFTGPSMTSSTFEPSQKPLQQDATKVFAIHNRKENSSDNNNNNNSNNQDPDDGDIEGEGDASIVVLDGVKSPDKNSSTNGRNKKDEDEKVEDDLPSDVENNDDDDDDDDCVVALDQNRIVEHISPLIQDDPPHKILTTPKPSQVASVNVKHNDSKNNNNEKSKKGVVDNSHNDSVVTIESEGGNDSVIQLPASIQLVQEQQQQRLQNSQQVTNNSSNVTNSSQTVTNNMNNNGKIDQKNNSNNQQPQHPRQGNGSNNSSALPKKLAAKIELDCLLFAVGSMKLRITLKTGNDKKTFMVPLLVQASHY